MIVMHQRHPARHHAIPPRQPPNKNHNKFPRQPIFSPFLHAFTLHNIITLISSHIFLLKNIKEFPQKKEEKANPFTFSSFGY